MVFHVIDIHKTPGSGSPRKIEITVGRKVAAVGGVVVGLVLMMNRGRSIVMMKGVGSGGIFIFIVIGVEVEVGI